MVATTGRGRNALLEPTLFRASKQNDIRDDLSSLVLSGSVSLDLDRDGSKMIFECELRSGVAVDPFLVYVAPFVRITYEDGSFDFEQVGLYALVPAGSDAYPG